MRKNPFRLPIYGKKTLKLAFELGVVLSEVAKENNVAVTPEISKRAEEILINELKVNGLEKTAVNFIPIILASFETK